MSSYSVPYCQKVHFENPRQPPSPYVSASSPTLADIPRSTRDSVACAACSSSCSRSYTPTETMELISRAGAHKGGMRPSKALFGAVSAGCLLAFAAAVNLRAQASPWLIANAPGVNGLIGAMVFPIGLVWIVLTGAELFTGAIMVRRGCFLFLILSPLPSPLSPPPFLLLLLSSPAYVFL